MGRLDTLTVYDGIHELLPDLRDGGYPLAILTKSPAMIPQAFVDRYRWPVDIVLGYHDVTRHKPDPQGLLLAIRRADADPYETFCVGDHPDDTRAARAAGANPIGAAWGLDDPRPLEASKPSIVVYSVPELREILLHDPA